MKYFDHDCVIRSVHYIIPQGKGYWMRETKCQNVVVINPDYEHLRDYIQNVPSRFDSLGTIIDARRNIIREDDPKGTRLVIKAFKRIYLANRIRYSFFYPSKAQRAFDNARTLLKKGFLTPIPIAYIEIRHNGLINQSFFISEYVDFQPLEKPEVKSAITLELLKDLAKYTFNLHRSNIYHIDYTLGNILFKKINNRLEFSLVDNNRMKFTNVSFDKGIRNFVRLALPDTQLEVIAKEYARLWKNTEDNAYAQLVNYKKIIALKNSIVRSVKIKVKSMLGMNPVR